MTKEKRVEIVKAMIENAYACANATAETDPKFSNKMRHQALGLTEALYVFTKDTYAKDMAKIYEISL